MRQRRKCVARAPHKARAKHMHKVILHSVRQKQRTAAARIPQGATRLHRCRRRQATRARCRPSPPPRRASGQ
eukprot:7177960-Prymnesium_polylepis.1